jgi:hypothetical protein
MNAQVASEQLWPNWAKALLIAMAVLAVLIALPWIFIWTTMAASCAPMMNGMPGVMEPGMMR